MKDSTRNADRATVTFFDGLSIDGYMMPNGEFRVSMTGASILLGFAPNWLGRTLTRGGNAVKALHGLGFSGQTEKVVTQSIEGGGRTAETISLKDLQRILVYGVQRPFTAGRDRSGDWKSPFNQRRIIRHRLNAIM